MCVLAGYKTCPRRLVVTWLSKIAFTWLSKTAQVGGALPGYTGSRMTGLIRLASHSLWLE